MPGCEISLIGSIGTFVGIDAPGGNAGGKIVDAIMNVSAIAWNGSGIVTSTADAASCLKSLGVATAAQTGYAGGSFGGVSVSATDVLVM